MSILQTLTDLPDSNLAGQVADFQRRYDGSIMLVTTPTLNNIPHYVKLRSTQLRMSTNNTEFFADISDKNLNLTPYLPKVGYYNVNGRAILLLKNPRKQYLRSFSSGFYKIYSANKETSLDTNYDFLTVAETCLTPEYVNLDEVTNKMFTNIALNRLFAVTKHKNNNFLTYLGCAIGELDHTKKEIKLVFKPLEQEIKDLFKRTGVKQWTLSVA